MPDALTEIRISRSALIHNVKAFRRVIGSQVKLMAVVKSNAYGHGVGECAPVFAKAGADWFGVASLSEALKLRKTVSRKKVIVLSYIDGDTQMLTAAIQQGIRLPAYTVAQLCLYQRVARKLHKHAIVHLKFDTGTTRIGFLPKDLPQVVKFIRQLSNVRTEGVYSHFAEVEAKQQTFSQMQHRRFATLAESLELSLGKQLIKHMDCSAGVLVHPDAHFDMVRIGMSLYGILTVADLRRVHVRFPKFSLRPALSWYTRVLQVKNVPSGTTIGYNRTYTTKRPTNIAVLPVGYWDGLDRKLSNVGKVLICKQYAPIRGRVCMNLTMVDVTDIPSTRAGRSVTLIGCDGTTCIPAETLAKQIGTIPYEVLTRINPLLPRTLVP
jgi:alanine racemase